MSTTAAEGLPVEPQEKHHHSVVDFIKKVEHKIIHPTSHEADYKSTVESNQRGRKKSVAEAQPGNSPDAVAAAKSAENNEKTKLATDKRAEGERHEEAAAAARAADGTADGDVLHSEGRPRRRSLSEKLKDGLKHEVDLVEHQASRAKVPVIY